MLLAFDHINIRTANLARMIAWYTDVLGLVPGVRPDFPFPGAWLYLGDHALVHLVEVETPPKTSDPRLEHFALRASDMELFLQKLRVRDQDYRVSEVPGFGIAQVNIHDPDGNHIHIDFSADDAG